MWFVNTVDAKNENDTDAEIIFVPAQINTRTVYNVIL